MRRAADGQRLVRVQLELMQPPRPPLTEAAALFIAFALSAALVGAATVGLTVASGDLRVLELGCAFSAVCAYFALVQLRAARRGGWRRRRGEDDNGDGWRRGGRGPSTPPPTPSGGPVDWERFTAEFWAYVDDRRHVGVS